MADRCHDPKMLLPMWRWTWTNYVWSDWGGFWDFSQIRAAIGGSYDLVVRVLFMIASLIWYLLSRLLYMVLSADFAGAIADDINGTYKLLAEALIKSGVLFIVATIAFVMSAWSLYRYDTHTAWRRVVTSWIMLGLLLSMLWPLQAIEAANGSVDPDTAAIDDLVAEGNLAADDADAQRIVKIRQHAATQRGTPLWLYSAILDVSDEVSYAITDLALGLAGDGNPGTHSSYCSVYTQQLEKLYLETVSWKNAGEEPEAKQLTPIFLSRLWERAYLGPWSRAQFGSPQTAYNGSCLWAEANTGHVSAPETMAVWSASCGYVGGLLSDPRTELVNDGWGEHVPLYGCGRNVVAGGASIPPAKAAQSYSPAQQDRAWRTFYPDGDTETLVFLNLVSGCGLAAPRSGTSSGIQADENGYPQIPPGTQPRVHEDGSLLVRVEWGYIEQGRIGMRPDKAGDEGEWFSFDVCAAWLTGTGAVVSGVDNRTGQRMGFYETPGVAASVGSTVWGVWGVFRPTWLLEQIGIGEPEPSQAASHDGEPQGLNSNYVKHRGDIGCVDAEVSAANVVENMAPNPGLRTVTSAEHAYAAASDICTFGGGRMFDRILNGFIVMLVAFSFAFSLLGMTVGTALAQILLVVVIMGLPVVLVASAIPTAATRGLLKQTLKLGLFAAIAHAVFVLILASMVFLIDILVEAVSQATPPGSYLRILLIAVIPFIVKKIIAGFGKRMNLDFTSMKGGMRVTSGLAASGFGNDRSSLGDRAGYFRRSLMHGATSGAMRGGAGAGPRGLSFTPNTAIASATGRPGGPGAARDSAAAGGASAALSSSQGDRSSVLNARSRVEPPGSRAGARPPPPPRPPTPPPAAETVWPGGGPSTAGWGQNNDGLLIPPGSGRTQPTPTPTPTPTPDGSGDGDALDPGTDYDPNPETRRSPRGRIQQTVGKAGRYALKHPLATFATLGALSGVGLPAAAAVYLGGKAAKFVLRGPRRLIRRAASNVADSGALDRGRDAVLGSQIAVRMQERAAQPDQSIVSIDPMLGPPAPPTSFGEPDGSGGGGGYDSGGGYEGVTAAPTSDQRLEPTPHAPAPQPQREAMPPPSAPPSFAQPDTQPAPHAPAPQPQREAMPPPSAPPSFAQPDTQPAPHAPAPQPQREAMPPPSAPPSFAQPDTQPAPHAPAPQPQRGAMPPPSAPPSFTQPDTQPAPHAPAPQPQRGAMPPPSAPPSSPSSFAHPATQPASTPWTPQSTPQPASPTPTQPAPATPPHPAPAPPTFTQPDAQPAPELWTPQSTAPTPSQPPPEPPGGHPAQQPPPPAQQPPAQPPARPRRSQPPARPRRFDDS